MIPNKTFLFFLLDTPTGKAYYRDATGTIKTLVITAGSDVSLSNAPLNWLDIELSFTRNNIYHGINRSYSTPAEFVRDAVIMIKELFLLGEGTEVPLTLAVFKYNSQPLAGDPQYKLYYKGNLDLPKISENVLETLTVNLMEGGIMQLLKSYENTVLQIPCDGQIAENQKINFDGLLLPDTFQYQITPINDIGEVKKMWSLATPVGCAFINNQGDNYGIIHNDETFENINYSGLTDPNQVINYSKISRNYIFLSVSAITVTIKGTITVRFNNPSTLQIYVSTSTGQLFAGSEQTYGDSHKIVIFNFTQKVSLAASEGLFLFLQMYNPAPGSGTTNIIDILDGSFSVAFNSQAIATRVWAIQAFDLFKLIIKQICLLASTTAQPLNFEAVSNLLTGTSFYYTSGDALRASGDSSYQRFFSLTQTNQILQTSFGPVIKISLKEFFEDIDVRYCAAMGNSHNGVNETVYIEHFQRAYNSSAVTFDIGEVASLKWKFADDLAFSDIDIGYEPKTYDQKAGKYEYNTTLSMKAPIKTFQKKLTKVSKIRWDSYGMERLRANIGAPTSTTRNDSDSSVFGVNTAPWDGVSYDYFKAVYTSLIPNPDDAQNTNIILQQNVSCQVLPTSSTDGEFFQPNLDQAIIVFSVPGFAAIENCNLTITGTINSVNKPPLAPTDSITIKLWYNGVALYTFVIPVTGVNTPISINQNFVQTFSYKDCVYISMSTTASGEATISSAVLNIGTYVSMSAAANIPVDIGTAQKLLSWSTVSPVSNPYTSSSVVQYGYQYFVFNSLVPNTNFLFGGGFTGYVWNQAANFQFDVYINGILQETITLTGTVARNQFGSLPLSLIANFAGITRNYTLGDIVFITGSVLGTSLNVEITNVALNFTSTQIKLLGLYRVAYDYLQGIPNIALDVNGNVSTAVAGAPYNIEGTTPKTIYNNWKPYIMSTFLSKVTGQMIFQTLSKNQYLQRSYLGIQIIENSNEEILDSERLFYPIEVEMKTNVPVGFAELMSSTINAHVHATFMGTDIYFFPKTLKQKPALNESQTWVGLLSPVTDLTAFANINSFKIPTMSANSISCAFASPVQFVPYNQSIAAKYHTFNRDTFLFTQQTSNWLNQDNYGQPVQIGDIISLQFTTWGLSPVAYTVYNCDGTIYTGPTNLVTVVSPAVSNPYTLWQVQIDTTAWPRNDYFMVVTAGIGALSATLISEPLSVRTASELYETVLIEYSNSFNTQGMVFDALPPFVGSMRFRGGFDNKFKQKYLGKFYTDQPQNITVLNAIPYEVTNLVIVNVPDYVAKKILRMLLMDGCMLDGEGFTLNDGAEFEEVFTRGAPMKIQKVEIRPSKNKNAINVIAAGVDTDSSLVVSVNPQSFGPNITNASGTTETDLINITVS